MKLCFQSPDRKWNENLRKYNEICSSPEKKKCNTSLRIRRRELLKITKYCQIVLYCFNISEFFAQYSLSLVWIHVYGYCIGWFFVLSNFWAQLQLFSCKMTKLVSNENYNNRAIKNVKVILIQVKWNRFYKLLFHLHQHCVKLIHRR